MAIRIHSMKPGPSNATQGCVLRANIAIAKGATSANRSDIEVLFDQLPEPIGQSRGNR